MPRQAGSCPLMSNVERPLRKYPHRPLLAESTMLAEAGPGLEATVGHPSQTGHWGSLLGHLMDEQRTDLPRELRLFASYICVRGCVPVFKVFYTWMLRQCIAMNLRLQAMFRRTP